VVVELVRLTVFMVDATATRWSVAPWNTWSRFWRGWMALWRDPLDDLIERGPEPISSGQRLGSELIEGIELAPGDGR
jgi:hypothetical protein